MSLLLGDDALGARRAVVGPGGSLEPLAQSLAADLEPLLARELYFPAEKALLSRGGGRCARDGTLLDFDPFKPHEHRCPRCGVVYRGELHDRFWIYWYQLWLAERAVHGAALGVLCGDPRYMTLASDILAGYANRYESYPNIDNVLGPTRLFFSTYLESIWLLQVCVATDLLSPTNPGLASTMRDKVIAPSSAIIAEYDEGGSNRQVWNDVALFAAARMLGDDATSERAIFGESGIAFHLASGLLGDGTWFEGENYHLFAHRGLWYGVTMAERAGMDLPAALAKRFERGFSAPFMSALPDFTLPSRRDSQYAISLRQWRIAEHCELGLARASDPLLLGAVRRMYGDDVPRGDTGRARSSADAERNAPPTSLTRADLSWRGLLCALPVLPDGASATQGSALLDGQGLAVFRRDGGRVYAAVDYGQSGGGHGHPDRLNLLLSDGDTRWLDDYGTGSYVDPSLHWYRSSLAHNAPFVNDHSQIRIDGTLLAYEERGDIGWVAASAYGIAPDVNVERTVIVMPTYLLDVVEWHAENPITLDLPLHIDAEVDGGTSSSMDGVLTGGGGLEDGFDFVRMPSVGHASANATVRLHATTNDKRLDVWATSTADAEWWRAVAPGPPGCGDRAFRVVRANANQGVLILVWSWAGDVRNVEFERTIRVTLADGTTHEHLSTDDGMRIEIAGPTRHETIVLGGAIDNESAAVADALEPRPPEPAEPPLHVGRRGPATLVTLGEEHYRRSEQSWSEAGGPGAQISLSAAARALAVTIDVPRSDLNFVAANAKNTYDNESPDINGDGVQLYVHTPSGLAGWLLTPDISGDRVRIRPIDGWTAKQAITATWARVGDGYRMSILLLAAAIDAIDVVVNEMPRGRVRRRGQLVMSGAEGEFVYLRGDRHDPNRLIPLRFDDE